MKNKSIFILIISLLTLILFSSLLTAQEEKKEEEEVKEVYQFTNDLVLPHTAPQSQGRTGCRPVKQVAKNR